MKTVYLTGAVTINEKTGQRLYAGEHQVSDELYNRIASNKRVTVREAKVVTPQTSQPGNENKAL